MIPKLVIASLANETYVFMDGKCISGGIEDITYHARNKDGELRPTLEMNIDVPAFSFDGDMSFDDFVKEIGDKREFLSAAFRVNEEPQK